MDLVRKLNVGRTVIAPVTGTLHGAKLRELGFPIAQDVLGDAQFLRKLTDRL